MKKKLGDITLRESKKICHKNTERTDGTCDGCPLNAVVNNPSFGTSGCMVDSESRYDTVVIEYDIDC